MSRIGLKPIVIPAGVTVELTENNVITVKGPKATLTQTLHPDAVLSIDGNVINVSRKSEDKFHKSLHGLTRSLVNNMVVGVTDGFAKTLEIVGVGYRAAKAGTTLTLNLGYSHPIVFEEGNGITFEVPNSNTVVVKGADKQAVGQIAAEIRKKRPPEPYLGKGVKYQGEYIRRKAGKTGK